jgi:hypothetical protein
MGRVKVMIMTALIGVGFVIGFGCFFWGMVFGSISWMIGGLLMIYIPIAIDKIFECIADRKVRKLQKEYKRKHQREYKK